jgi:bacterioferritin
MASFIKDIEEIRERARRKIDEGAVTEAYGLDKNRAINVLNEALATEIVCVLRYMHHYFMATGVHGRAVADEFKEHADDEREHAGEIAERIQQLGGKPDFNPASLLQRSVSHYVEGETLADMIREDLIAERTVIDVYQEMIQFFGEKDPTTRRMLEHIKAEEEEHASDLSDYLFIVNPQSAETEGQDPGTNPLEEGFAKSCPGRSAQQQGARNEAAMRRPSGVERTGRGEALAGLNSLPGQSPQAPGRDKTHSLNVSPTPQKRGGVTQSSGDRGFEQASGSNLPGVGGRTMNRRRTADDIDKDDVAKQPNAGGSGGTNRSAKILNKKGKRAA